MSETPSYFGRDSGAPTRPICYWATVWGLNYSNSWSPRRDSESEHAVLEARSFHIAVALSIAGSRSMAGAGYEYDAERFFRDARIYRIYEGTTQIVQLQSAKHMLREFNTGTFG